MTFKLPKYTIGTKFITIRDPVFVLDGIKSGRFTPVVKILRVTKDDDVLYTCALRDNNTSLEVECNIEIPEEYSQTVKIGLAINSDDGDNKIPIWETHDSLSQIYKDQIGALLACWLEKIKQVSTFEGEAPRIIFPSDSCELKFPWTKTAIEEYFNNFNPDTQVHTLRIGVGYFNRKNNYIGNSLQLCSFTGKTIAAAEQAKISARKRRRKENEDSSENEQK